MIVMTFGTFDRFHAGHQYYLSHARKLGDTLITIVARDATVLRVKGHTPRDSEDDRAAHVAASGIPDITLLGSLDDPYAVLLEYRPDILCFGYDQRSFNTDTMTAFLAHHGLDPAMITIDAHEPHIFKSSLL